jgi:hypothetical protein
MEPILAGLAYHLSANERHAISMVVRDLLLEHLHDVTLSESERAALMQSPSPRHFGHVAGELGVDHLTHGQRACVQLAWRDTLEDFTAAAGEDLSD